MTSTAPADALAAVRAATSDLHEGLEARLVLSRPDAGRAAYVTYAAAMWGWLAALEPALWSAPWPAELEAPARDDKRAWLAEDLSALGYVGTPPVAAGGLDLSTLAARFGVAYVVEGSQLGGQVLLRRLGPALAPHVPRYLLGYGASTGGRWRGFVGALQHTIVSPAEVEVAARAARAAFLDLARWFEARGAA